MKLIIFVAVVVAIAAIFGIVYGISALVARQKRQTFKTTAPDDDPQFLRDLARRLAEQDNAAPQPKAPEEPAEDDETDGDKR
jgi:hypothetical protein